MVKSIVAYHAEILVRDESGGVVKLCIDLDDWYSVSDVAFQLAEMMAKFTPSTLPRSFVFGELVTALSDVAEEFTYKAPVLSARVEPGGQGTDSASIKKWNDPVV